MSPLLDYRAYLLDEGNHVVKRHDFEARSDADALTHAGQYVDGHDVEVWQPGRVVGKLSHK